MSELLTAELAQTIAEVEERPYCTATGRPHRWGKLRRRGLEQTRRCLDCKEEVFMRPMEKQ